MAVAAAADVVAATARRQRLALAEAQRLLRGGALGVAVTGSVARGHASHASDVDLWVLSDRSERLHFRRGGLWVSHLVQQLDEARAFDNFCLWDVDELWVVADPHRHFARLKADYARQRDAVRRDVLDATGALLGDLAAQSRRGSAWQQQLTLQELAWRAASLRAFVAGWGRVPKLRVLRRVLPRPAVAALGPALGLRRRPATTLWPAWDALAAQARRFWPTRAHAPPPVQAPGALRADAAREPEDVQVTLRRLLALDLVPWALEDAQAQDVSALVDVPWAQPLLAVLRALHGLPASPADARSVPACRARVGRLWRALALKEPAVRAVGRQLSRW